MTPDIESKYRGMVGDLAALLAHEKLPGATGQELIAAAMQIVIGTYERHGMPTQLIPPPLQAPSKGDGAK